jgi:AcrR family transcriptional regulator
MAVDSRETIRSAAIELFARLGYEKTSLREIADRVGMTKASLYYHYPSKQALLQAIVAPLIEQWRAVADRAQTLPHDVADVRSVLAEILEVQLAHRPIASMFVHDAAAIIPALGSLFGELLEQNLRLHSWLAGPDPTPQDRVRAVAATEALGAALGWSPFLEGVSDGDMHRALLDAAAAVLGLHD